MVEHAFVAGIGVGFEKFDNVREISTLNLPRNLAEPSAKEEHLVRAKPTASILVLRMYQESLQWCAFNFSGFRSALDNGWSAGSLTSHVERFEPCRA